jgi:hypothetical protein
MDGVVKVVASETFNFDNPYIIADSMTTSGWYSCPFPNVNSVGLYWSDSD